MPGWLFALAARLRPARGCAATSSPASPCGRCSCPRRSRTRRSPASRPSSACTRRPGALLLYAALRQLAPPRRRPDVGHRGALGRDGRRARRAGPAGLRRADRGARRDHRDPRARSPACCGSGFLAGFISEPVLKGFIVGLALTIIIGPAAEALRGREGRRRLLRAAVGPRSRALGDTSARDARGRRALARGRARPAAVRARRAGLARRGRARRARRRAARRSTTTASTSSGTIDAGPAAARPARRGRRRLPRPRGGRGGHRARRLRRGARRGQDVRRARTTTTSTRTAS